MSRRSLKPDPAELGIRCPVCNCAYCPETPSLVVRTNSKAIKNRTRRRRRCQHCGKQFTTYESVADGN